MSNPSGQRKPGFATSAIHAGYSTDSCNYSPVIPPIITSASFGYETVDKPAGSHYYSRCGNPSRDILETAIAVLEDAKYGLCFSSGMAAIFAVTHLLNPSDHIICSQVLYGGTLKLLREYTARKGIEISFIDMRDPSNVEKEIKSNTKLVFVESCENPTLNVVDIERVASIVKKHPGTIFAVDNTFMTPYFQKPLKQGADIVVHSLSKYLNGHGDVVMGALVTNRIDIYDTLKDILTSLGLVPSPFDCYLVTRGLKTLHIRMREHMHNATAVAKFLEIHPLVERVLYPGLVSHPQHELAKRQCSGFGGMVGLYIRGQRKEMETFLHNLKLIEMTGSLGQPNSLACYPITVSHTAMDIKERSSTGITDNFVRLSIGLESVEDIIEDIKQALESIIGVKN